MGEVPTCQPLMTALMITYILLLFSTLVSSLSKFGFVSHGLIMQAFVESSKLKRHQLVHTGEKPFQVSFAPLLNQWAHCILDTGLCKVWIKKTIQSKYAGSWQFCHFQWHIDLLILNNDHTNLGLCGLFLLLSGLLYYKAFWMAWKYRW